MDTNDIYRHRPPESERICARLPRDLLDSLDAFALDRSVNPMPISRPEAMRQLLRNALVETGYLKADEPRGQST